MADVLIAEDDADIREWVALALTKAHYRVRTVADGAAALVAYAERRPDILILDIMMPRKSGYDVCIEIRKKDRQLPIIMLTAKGTEQDKVLGLDLGADDYLAKPFGLSELKARVAALLRRAAMPPAETPGETGMSAEAYSLALSEALEEELLRRAERVLRLRRELGADFLFVADRVAAVSSPAERAADAALGARAAELPITLSVDAAIELTGDLRDGR